MLLKSSYKWVLMFVAAATLMLVVACSGDDEVVPTAAPAAVAPTAAPAATEAPPAASSGSEIDPTAGGELKDVPRAKTLISYLGGAEGRFTDHQLWNPYAIGANHQTGPNIIFEPLAFFSAFADETTPWLATDWSYNSDFTELVINLRTGVNWSDGEEFNADDVAYTLNTLKDLKEEVRWGNDIDLSMEKAEVTGSHQVTVTLARPDPRFMFLLTYKYDIGVYMVPEHHYSGKDWPSFTDYDEEKGWPLTTGPWRVARGTPEQKIIDRRDSWWGEGVAQLGQYAQLPEVERIIYLPTPDQTARAQSLIADEVDYASMTTPAVIFDVLDKNTDLVTHTYRDAPGGYVDWWPISLAFNDTGKFGPYDKKEVRWAFSNYIDREQVLDVAFDGNSAPNALTMPKYPPLIQYFDAIDDILSKPEFDTTLLDPARGDARLTSVGFTKDSDGMWKDAAGVGIDCEILGFSAFADSGPLIAEQLRNNGINASYIQPPDVSSRMAEGNFECLMFGHGGSIRDPYFTMKLYQSSSVNIPGGHQVNFYHWENAEFDALTDKVGRTDPDDVEAVKAIFHDAMEIWLDELPDVPLFEWYHRIVMSEKRWTNWPLGTEITGYTNEASWHLTWSLVLHNLKSS